MIFGLSILQLSAPLVKLELGLLKAMPASTFFIFLLSAVISIVTSYVNRRFTNVEEQREWGIKSSEVRKEMLKAVQGGNKRLTERLQKEQAELMKAQSKITMQRLKLQLFFIIPLLALWQLLGPFYGSSIVAMMPFNAPFVGTELNLFWWYFFSAMVTSVLTSRLFGLTFEMP